MRRPARRSAPLAPAATAGATTLTAVLLAASVLAAFAPPAAAQGHRLRFDRLSREEGLSQISVLAVLQDRRGFMWFGTQDGLNRYDGYKFTVFRHQPDNPASLSQNFVNGIFEDGDGTLWIVPAQPGVLNRYDPVTARFRRFVHDPDDPSTLAPVQINAAAMWDDGDGHLWLGTFGGGVEKLDKTAGTVEHLSPDPADPDRLAGGNVSTLFEDGSGVLWIGTFDGGLQRRRPPDGSGQERFERPRGAGDVSEGDDLEGAPRSVSSLYEDRDGALWIGTPVSGLVRLDRERTRFERHAHDPADPGSLASDLLPAATVLMPRPVVEDHRGDLWVVTAAGLSRRDRASGRFTHYRNDPENPRSLPANAVTALHEDRSGSLWVGTGGGGLGIYDPEDDGFFVVRRNPTDPKSLSSDFVTTLYEGRAGILWVGTNEGGLSKFSPQSHRFAHYAPDPFDPRGLADGMTFGMLEDSSGRLWVGTMAGGLHRFDTKREEVTARFHLDPGSPRDLGADWVRCVMEDRRGRIWVGTQGAGLVRLDEAGERVAERFFNRPGDSSSLSNNLVYHIFEDGDGILWVSTSGGWDRLDPDTGTLTRHANRPGDPQSLPNNIVRVTFEDRDGQLWVGTSQGLSRFDREDGTFTTWRHDFRDPGGLSHDNIMDLWQNEEGRLWVATYGGGLNHFDPATGRAEHLTTADGLPNDSIYSVLPDDDGILWLSTNQGLARLDPEGRRIQTYGVEDGLQGIEFNARAFAENDRGELFFGGVNGFNVFHPREIRKSAHVPPVVITAFRKFGRPVDLGRAPFALDEVRLSWRDKYFSFEFSALDYARPERNQYAYKLEGFDPDWIQAGTRREADYTNLGGGRYLFRVKAANGDGVWNEEGASLRVVIVPPPWKTWWAYSLYALSAFGAVFAYVRFKTAHHREELERQHVEAEHRRKSEELERARRVQLSLLPECAPSLADLSICAQMKTATEVGGDFYDFFPQPDGSLYVATGDATGHGLSAGMMVAMTKTALKALEVAGPQELLGRLDAVLRAVQPAPNREHMRMALSLVHIRDGRVAVSSAGMPPVYLYHAASGTVEEILLPALPLASGPEEAYRCREASFARGDALVLLSDGLPELLDGRGRQLGYEAIAPCLAEHGERPAEEIAAALLTLGERFAAGHPAGDDITVVVVKRG